jgi:protein-S-isoprenylcysteine O-methyltransferase Ste14
MRHAQVVTVPGRSLVLFAIRAVIEERALEAGLPGYANYITRVHYRLLPGLW